MLETKQLTVFMSESLNHLFNRFIQFMEYIQKFKKWLSLSESVDH